MAATFGNLDLNGDIIDKKAFDRTLKEKNPADIAVFVGHNSSMLPVGIPLEMRVTPEGLFTRTKIFKTQAGDDLLQTARELQSAGQPLGMSIGFQTRDSKWQTKDGKTFRLLTDADLMEYSYAAKQVIASPPALVTAVKTRTKGAGSMADHEHYTPGEQPVWSTAFIQGLPDAAFAFIEDGGEEVESKTVPHTLRHFPHHNEDGSINIEAVKREMDRAGESPFKDHAYAHLRSHAMAEGIVGDGAKVASAAISEIAATLADLSIESGDVVRALAMGTRLGFDGQKLGVRLKGTMRAKLKNIKAALDELLTWAENVEDVPDTLTTIDGKTRGGTAKRALERAKFASAIAWDGKTDAGELKLDDLHNGLTHLRAAIGLLDGDAKARKKWDPDGDGDDDSTPEGDTDHDYWTADGRQKKPVPGKPMDGKAKGNKPPWLEDDDEDDQGKKKKTSDAVDHLADALYDLVGHHDAIHSEHEMKLFEQKGVWDSAHVNDLPDSAFAAVYDDASGNKQRKLPHHDSDGSVDLPHLRNALARVSQMTGVPDGVEAKAKAHLEAHAKKLGVGDSGSDEGKTKRNGKPTNYTAALKDMELTLARYQQPET
jgi:HK97 family phage prohead protease